MAVHTAGVGCIFTVVELSHLCLTFNVVSATYSMLRMLHILYDDMHSGGAQSSKSVDSVLHVDWEPSRAASVHVAAQRGLCLRPGRLRHALQSPHVHWHSWATRWSGTARALCHAGRIWASHRAIRRHRWHCQCQTCQWGSQRTICCSLECCTWLAGWLGSRVVSVLDWGAVGPEFKSQPQNCHLTVLDELFTPLVPLFTKQRNC